MLVESGNIVDVPNKLPFVTSVLAALKYDAIGVGETDARACGQTFYDEAAKKSLTVLNAAPDAGKPAAPHTVKVLDGVRVGIFAFNPQINATAGSSDYDRRKALYVAYKQARDASDVLVVLDQGNVVNKDWLERNAPRLGAPDVVIGGLARAILAKPEIIGKTHIVQTSSQGKSVGVVDIEISEGHDPVLASRMIAVDDKVKEDQQVAAQVNEFVMQLKNLQPAPAPPPVANVPDQGSDSPNKPYYSMQSCRTCHSKIYDSWANSRHAHAIQTLADRDRMIPECLTCHSEMFRRLQRATVANDKIGGVECATCHMQALPHGMERRSVAVKTKVDVQTCLVCHTKDRSPKFEQKSYYAKVAHGDAERPKTATAPRATPPMPPMLPQAHGQR